MMQCFRQNRANRERLAPVFHNGKQSENSDNSCPNGEPTFTVNASAEDHLASKKDHTEGTESCRICKKSLPVIQFSKSQRKKLKKANAKGNSMQLVCTGCTMSNVSNKKARGSEAVNQLGNNRGATVSKSRPDNGKGMERSPNNFQSQQRSSTANSSSSQPSAAPRSTHDSNAKNKSRDSEKQPRKVMTAAANRVVTQPQPLAASQTTTPTLTLTRVLRLTHN